MQIDFLHPTNISAVETINAEKKVEVDGVEVDLTLMPIEGLVLGLNYTYLDGDMPLQPHPLKNNELTAFELTQTPQHAGSLTVDYTFEPWGFGVLEAYLDVTSTDQYAYAPLGSQRFDAYTLYNARITLADIRVGRGGALKFSAWGKNLTDEEYVVLALPINDPITTVIQAFGEPRTAGLDVSYKF